MLISASGLIALIALVVAVAAHSKLSSARRSLAMLQGTYEGKTLLDAVAYHVDRVEGLGEQVQSVIARQQELLSMITHSARHVGVLRYDAFEDMGGQMSFSAALLDDYGDGLVITGINGRTEARTYAKTVEGGESDFNLSPEESKVISEALSRSTKTRK